ncbi:protein LURP-one-related 6 [Panicum miliaceum]|uniref:Protein LURP-one-related 6 n=1 Tax=Panicum miliaceum TaxID=4540 RepID=A0A3L6Q7K4_PANMI|nr:protein LURP-one-related 6 [Panicum miliaceum]
MDNSIPVVSKIFCSGTPTMLMIRRRPIVVNGGGFVVTDLSHNVVFVVDGCGILGSKGEIMVKDGEGEPILFISKKRCGNSFLFQLPFTIGRLALKEENNRDCTIVDCTRKIVAQMGRKELIGGKDFYHVEVQSGYDQAFIIGVVAILDNIHGESTRC